MENLQQVAQHAALEASQLIQNAWQNQNSVKIHEKAPKDLVTDIDRAVEQRIINIIHSNFPSHSILSEESGLKPGDDFTWIIDPIDGTTNFCHGIPHFAISIAIKHQENLVMGVIYDPIRKEMFSAKAGEGAFLNGQRIKVSKKQNLDNAVIATGFPSKRQQFFPGFMECLTKVFPELLGIRRGGAATLDLAYIAAGRIDGYWEFDVKEWDVAAGELIIKEAGGTMCDISGKADYPKHGVIAGTTGICQSLVQTFASTWLNQLETLFRNYP